MGRGAISVPCNGVSGKGLNRPSTRLVTYAAEDINDRLGMARFRRQPLCVLNETDQCDLYGGGGGSLLLHSNRRRPTRELAEAAPDRCLS